MKTRFQSTLLWLLLAVYGLAGIGGAQSLVLCVGEDGHVAVEWKAAAPGCEGCSDESDSDDPLESGATHGEAESCGCLDVPLLVASEQPDATRLDERSEGATSLWTTLFARGLVPAPWFAPVDRVARPAPPPDPLPCAWTATRTMQLNP